MEVLTHVGKVEYVVRMVGPLKNSFKAAPFVGWGIQLLWNCLYGVVGFSV